MNRIAPIAPPKAAPPNYTAVLAAFGQSIWGAQWAAGMARMTGVNSRTLSRIYVAAREGRDYPASKGVLVALHQRLAPVAAELAPWAQHLDRGSFGMTRQEAESLVDAINGQGDVLRVEARFRRGRWVITVIDAWAGPPRTFSNHDNAFRAYCGIPDSDDDTVD